jgi:hypothetical protein
MISNSDQDIADLEVLNRKLHSKVEIMNILKKALIVAMIFVVV